MWLELLRVGSHRHPMKLQDAQTWCQSTTLIAPPPSSGRSSRWLGSSSTYSSGNVAGCPSSQRKHEALWMVSSLVF